jgi:hypothetical protein
VIVISFFIGVSLLQEVLTGFDIRHDTPPSHSPSPGFGHSSTRIGKAHMGDFRPTARPGRDDADYGFITLSPEGAFAGAIRRKLVLEIAGLAPQRPPTLLLRKATPPHRLQDR